jgi:mono/diheme cytochrome c family protein
MSRARRYQIASGVSKMTFDITRMAGTVLMGGLLSLSALTACANDVNTAGISEGFHFGQKDGESLYRAVCQSCHMPEGQGAQGAGMYPALAGNSKLAASRYPAYNVLHGRKGMPGFKNMLSDEQIAEVTNYVRTHMGNNYKDALTAADVKALR